MRPGEIHLILVAMRLLLLLLFLLLLAALRRAVAVGRREAGDRLTGACAEDSHSRRIGGLPFGS